MKYNVYDFVTGEPRLLGKVDENNQITGFRAELVKRLLIKGGWPLKDPMMVLYGDYCWAEEDEETEQTVTG